MTAVTKTVLVHGKHVVGDLYGCDAEKLKDVQFLLNVVKNAARIGNMTLLDIKAWKIGEGVSVLGIVLESHISIHTWPEFSFATVDVYSCGERSDPDKAFNYIVRELRAKRVEKRTIQRNLELDTL